MGIQYECTVLTLTTTNRGIKHGDILGEFRFWWDSIRED